MKAIVEREEGGEDEIELPDELPDELVDFLIKQRMDSLQAARMIVSATDRLVAATDRNTKARLAPRKIVRFDGQPDPHRDREREGEKVNGCLR